MNNNEHKSNEKHNYCEATRYGLSKPILTKEELQTILDLICLEISKTTYVRFIKDALPRRTEISQKIDTDETPCPCEITDLLIRSAFANIIGFLNYYLYYDFTIKDLDMIEECSDIIDKTFRILVMMIDSSMISMYNVTYYFDYYVYHLSLLILCINYKANEISRNESLRKGILLNLHIGIYSMKFCIAMLLINAYKYICDYIDRAIECLNWVNISNSNMWRCFLPEYETAKEHLVKIGSNLRAEHVNKEAILESLNTALDITVKYLKVIAQE